MTSPPFTVRWHFLRRPRVLEFWLVDPVIGVTTSMRGGW